MTVFEENDGAIEVGKKTLLYQQDKHIDARCHFAREKVDEKVVQVLYISTTRQSANGLTKTFGQRLLIVTHRKVPAGPDKWEMSQLFAHEGCNT